MATQNTAMDNAALIKEVNEAHKHKKYSVGYHAQTVVAVIVTLIMLFPLYWMIATSFKSAEEVQLVIPTLFPHEFHPENYLNVLQKANFMKYYWNTIVMTAGILLLQVGTGVLAAYGFAVGRFKGRNALFYVVLGALMIPLQVTFIPIYIMCANWDLCDTFLGLILPEAVSAYYIFMLRNTFMSIDQSYIDAGRIDGLSRLGTIWYVLVPMSKATIFTVTLVTFTNGWNAYFWPKIIAKNEVRRVLTVGLAQLKNTFAGQAVSNYHEIMAGAVLAIIPVVILFLIFQKYMMTGYSKAAMKSIPPHNRKRAAHVGCPFAVLAQSNQGGTCHVLVHCPGCEAVPRQPALPHQPFGRHPDAGTDGTSLPGKRLLHPGHHGPRGSL